MAQAVAGGQGVMVGADQGQLQQLQLQQLMQSRPSLPPGMMLGQGVQLGGVPGLPAGMQMGIPGMQGLVTSQPQLFARPPMLGLPGQQVMLAAGGGQMVVGQPMGAPQLQMQVQQSPFGPMLGAVPRFR